MFDALRAYDAAYAKGEKPPAAPGLTLVAHKTPAGSAVPYYIDVRPDFPRPPGGDTQGGAGRGVGAGGGGRGFGGGGGGAGGFPGGGPPGEGPPGGGPGGPPPEGGDVTGGSSTRTAATPEQIAARRAFQNSPAVKNYRAFVGCAYITLLAQSEAKAKGIVNEGGRPGLIYVPGIGLVFVRETQLPQGGGSVKSGT